MRQEKYLFYPIINRVSLQLLCMLAFLANLSARLGAGTTSSWGKYQPTLPKELSR